MRATDVSMVLELDRDAADPDAQIIGSEYVLDSDEQNPVQASDGPFLMWLPIPSAKTAICPKLATRPCVPTWRSSWPRWAGASSRHRLPEGSSGTGFVGRCQMKSMRRPCRPRGRVRTVPLPDMLPLLNVMLALVCFLLPFSRGSGDA
jgi:hypothetical protein